MTDPAGAETSPLATVVIPTYNGEIYVREILEALRTQQVDGTVEVLVIDSGSTDRTLQIVADFPEVRLHTIPNEEFGHGRTRNLGARLARGEFVAFITHDAVPSGPFWLAELLAPFAIDDRIVAVMGRQIPRAGCFPLMKYEIDGVFAQFGPEFGTSLFWRGDPPLPERMLDGITFYSDVNSAARRRFLTEVIPYRDVPYAEDQSFGRDLIAAGWWKAYAARGAVIHSNDVTFAEFGRRIFDETVGLRRIGTPVARLGLIAAVRLAVRGALGDSFRIARDPSWSRKRALYWLVVNPFFHLQKWLWYRRASRVDIEDLDAVRAGSLEHSRKR